ncbi:hypothetical protein [Streptomyces nodosus]|uniref:Uncharacterized protein n=1 Tax=Streptomyces nodosus TaxID=40318 RepID=A0A0B5DTK1_9ACTN|nr:hypothetical protein [Streptomyces nodosus]AJE44001.1 hypothetical protein SNOD_31410 [Streptomyces nodosus]MBB4795574.1 hypothetical protein [Streptomyces nodosus]QEV42501.1 hypothetical protein CP978_31705 [Streptomyces nodosus]
MTRHVQAHRITLDGREAVVLTPETYDQLVASRRQIGGQSARVRVLTQQVRRTEQFLTELERLVGDPVRCREQDGTVPTACPEHSPPGEAAHRDEGGDCLRCAIATLLRRHRDAAR